MAARKKGSGSQDKHYPWLDVPTPTVRALQVYAIDPSVGRYSRNCMTVHVPWEKLSPGPTGRKIGIVDYDAANKCYYPPVDLDDPLLLTNDGLDPSESDPRFHQQMVYAIASRTIQMFETALGRSVHWRRADRFGNSIEQNDALRKKNDIRVLKLYPHAMQQANAYYSPQAHGILFGFFSANKTSQGRNLPGQRVFTCLSQDIIAHEVTHAVIDGIRTYFTEPTNPDVLAFHEGFADLSALFAHFSHKDALIDTIQRTGGRLYETELAPVAPNGDESGKPGTPKLTSQLSKTNPLVQLAIQFGQARGAERGLRSALGSAPNSDDIHKNVDDPHFRGSILVAAVFDAFFTVYMERAENLFRIYRAGGASRTDDLPAPLAELLATCASDTATMFFRLCARALDYCPPVDLTFGDFLRALITVSMDLDSADDDGVRDALMDAFRTRGIYAESASFYSEDALCWPRAFLPPIKDLVFGSPDGLTSAEKDHNGDVLRKWAYTHRFQLKLDRKLPVTVPSFHPVFHTMENGRLKMEMVVEIIQSRFAPFDPHIKDVGSFPFRGGITLIVGAPDLKIDNKGRTAATSPEVRFAIQKPIVGPEAKQREQAQRSFAISQGLVAGDTTKPGHFQANFALLHEEY